MPVGAREMGYGGWADPPPPDWSAPAPAPTPAASRPCATERKSDVRSSVAMMAAIDVCLFTVYCTTVLPILDGNGNQRNVWTVSSNLIAEYLPFSFRYFLWHYGWQEDDEAFQPNVE
mmetsp:Transcript_24594/g.53276  ORF Transcript_24594/g.53276 Transcript_24594/m.53276 type:complete len:117 (+) Transcript_24594:4461-4811(+)